MAYNKGVHGSSGVGGHRGRPYAFMLLIAFGAALLGVMVLHKLRERRIYSLLVKEKDHQVIALQLLLQKESDRTKELRRKNEEMKAKINTLRDQKMELDRRVMEMKSTIDSLKEEQKVMESAFVEKQNELRVMQENGGKMGQGGSEVVAALRENLKQKEAEIQNLKHRIKSPPVSINDPTIVSGIVTANGTENGNREKDEHSSVSAKYWGEDKGIANEDGRKSKLTKLKDEVTAEIKNVQKNEEVGKKNEEAKGNDTEVVDGRENKAIREKDTNGGGVEDFKVKQQLAENSGVNRKHDNHASRIKGKRWRTIIENKLMENNNGVSESHEEVVERDNSNPRKENQGAKLPENQENKEDSKKSMIGNHTNHQVTYNGTGIHQEKHKLDEGAEEKKDSVVQRNWSRRLINKAGKRTKQTKFNEYYEDPEDLEVSSAQRLARDVNYNDDDEENEDFFKESHPDFEDEKEYREEIDETE